jgi:hypothetical protein
LGKMLAGMLAGGVRDWLVNHEVLSTFQAGFVRGKTTLNNVFIIKTIVDKYLREKRVRIYWCFVDFEKAMVNCIRIMYEGTKFFVGRMK